MANYKMYPGSRQKNSKGTFRKSQESVAQKLFKGAKQVIQDVTGYTAGKRVGEKIKQIKAKKQESPAPLKQKYHETLTVKKPMKSLSTNRKKPKAVVSTIKPRGIQTTPTPKPKATTMPTSKKAMSTMTKGPKPKLKPTSNGKHPRKIKEKRNKRGMWKTKIKYSRKK